MIPVFDSFDYFSNLLPLLLVMAPLVGVSSRGAVRRTSFIVVGSYLLFLIAPRLALFHMVFWLAIAAVQPVVAATGERRGGLAVLWSALALAIIPVTLWKVWPVGFVVEFNDWSHSVVSLPSRWLETVDFTADIVAPIGLSFAAFRAADLLVKSNLGLVERLTPGRVLGYGLFPPLLVVGPIASYDEVAATMERRVPLDRERVLDGVSQILAGLFKVFVIAFFLDWSSEIFVFYPDNSPWRLWVGLVAFTWFFYINFAGYSDLAIGAGTLLGATLRPNFDHPFQRTDPAAFWNNWHMSLTRFLRVNVFTAIVAGHPRRHYLGLTVTMLLIALWHSVSWATVVFGLYHAAALSGHRWLEQRREPDPRRPVVWAKSVMVFVWFALSLPLLQLNLGDAIDFYAALIGVST